MLSQFLIANINIPLDFTLFGIQSRDLLDILVVTMLIYAVIILLKKAHSLFLLNGIAVLAAIYIAARYLNLYLTSMLFSAFFGFFIIIFAVVFQRELRRFFEWLSSWRRFSRTQKELIPDIVSNHIIQTVERLAQDHTGALIVFPGNESIDSFIDGEIPLGGKVSSELLLSIFDTSSPGHDGAVIIQGDRVRFFGARLPLAGHTKNLENFGTRHHAALGLARRTDSLVVVVSEEKGTISVAENGEIQVLKDSTELAFRVHAFLSAHLLAESAEPKPWFFLSNIKEKTASAAIAVFLWYVFTLQSGAGAITRNFEIPIEFRSLPEGYIIEEINPAELRVQLSGKNQDFSFLNPDRLKAVVDLSETSGGAGEGKHKLTMEEKDVVNLPASVFVIQISPKTVQFSIKAKSQPNAKNH